ncbi:MAG: anti-sigma factor [Acidobacteria bacterium]|nr:anti-sigma factor [Acidobacteriota bacterium]
MTEHQQFTENLAPYALRALEGEEQAAMERHLEECAACRAELEELQGDMALLALTAAGPAPPQRAKKRLMEAMAREPRVQAGLESREDSRGTTSAARRPWWTFVPAFAAILVAVFAFVIWQENVELQSQVAFLHHEAQRQREFAAEARKVAEVLTAPEAAHFTLVAAPAKPVPQGRAIYLEKRGALVFVAGNLNPVPAGKTYELWLLPSSGAAPIPAGVFKPDARGSATVLTPPLPAGVEAKGFAVTIENEGGSQTPTMPIVMAGM